MYTSDTMGRIDIRLAVIDDAEVVLELREEAAAWTASGYVHRLVVRRDCASAGLGTVLVDWAAEQVRAGNGAWLRLDAAADNLPLCSYYERLGFRYRGDAQGELAQPDGRVRRWRNRLYERECAAT